MSDYLSQAELLAHFATNCCPTKIEVGHSNREFHRAPDTIGGRTRPSHPISHFAPWRVDFRRPFQHPARLKEIDDIADQRKLMLPHIMILNLKELIVILLIAVEVFDSAQAMAEVFMEMLLAARRKNS